MERSLFSQSWYRVADMKPRLRSHARIHRHTYRGKDWYVLQDQSTGRFHRFTQEAYHLIGLMDGRRTLKEIWEVACARLGDDMPTQDEVIGLLSQLHQADVLQSNLPPDVADLHRRYARESRNRWLSYLRSPVSLRLPLFDPERFLRLTRFVAHLLYNWASATLWIIVVLSSLVLVTLHWKELTSNMADRVLSLENLVLLSLIYPVVKALHEFGHAYAVKRWGGEVHEMGVMFLVFVPIPYVDASASSAFEERHKRVVVDAAGILVELFLASVAMLVWVNAEPGSVRAVAYNVMVIAGVSTLLFNGNPLLRFDAYYILSDLLEIPNLGLRANRYMGYVLQKYILGIKEAESPVTAKGEAGWLGFYAVASFCYRVFISIRIFLFVAGKFFVVGVVLALWAAVGMLGVPFAKVLRYIFKEEKMKGKRLRAIIAGLAFAGLVGALFWGVRLSSYTIAEGVLVAPEQSSVHAGVDGFVAQVLASPGHWVKQGEPLALCRDEDLASEVEALEARLREYEARYRISRLKDLAEADILKDEIDRIRSELTRARERQGDLLIRSPAHGQLILPDAESLPGRFLRRGTVLGYVVDFSRVTVQVVVPQSDVDQVRHKTRRVDARLASALERNVPCSLKREIPAASRVLPSMALSVEGGGSIALDPREKKELQSFENLFHFEIELKDVDAMRLGERVFVRFEHEPETLAARWHRTLRRVFLKKFNI